ncbi:MAG: hypothetical protein L0Y43_03455, partial [Methylococcaceae bacterium]|nr:hypothetical protein [Methylococcaceae bacterium]
MLRFPFINMKRKGNDMGTLITDRDQGLLDLLNAHPALRDRVEDLMQIVDDCEGTIEKADAAEQR